MEKPTITLHVLSDSIGDTAESVARALASQFPSVHFITRRTSMVRNPDVLRSIVSHHLDEPNYLFLYTFVKGEMHDVMADLIKKGAYAIDILGAAIARVERVTGLEPSSAVGALHRTDREYFNRIEAMEFSVAHDDGVRPEDLHNAEIVLIGVSRTSKTPLSMYMAYRGIKTANIPLTPGTEPPKELFEIDPAHIYGLVSTPEVLLDIRKNRMKELGTFVPEYAEREAVEAELANARSLMRKLGCIVINTANRAIEEVAQEILRYHCTSE